MLPWFMGISKWFIIGAHYLFYHQLYPSWNTVKELFNFISALKMFNKCIDNFEYCINNYYQYFFKTIKDKICDQQKKIKELIWKIFILKLSENIFEV